jgi:hypothetical protein
MGVVYNTSGIVTDGLVLALDAANPKSYPGSGTTWFDLSKSKYILTSNNPPSFTTDNLGNKCFEYTGAGKYFDSTVNSPFSGNSFAISVSATLNQFSTGDYYGILTQNEQSSVSSMAFLSLNGRFGTDHWSPGGRRIVTAASNNIVHHVTWTIPSWQTHQDSTTKIYINGIEQATEEYSRDTVGNLLSAPFRIGNWQLNRTDMDFQGRIYTVSVYNRTLTASEINQNFNALRGRYGI